MLKRIVSLVVAVLFVSNVPATLPQQEQPQPIFTFVSEWQIPRANWAGFSDNEEKKCQPDSRVVDGGRHAVEPGKR